MTQRAAEKVARYFTRVPRIGVILGSGMGSLADHFEVEAAINYADLPGFLSSTAAGHRGRLLCAVYRSAELEVPVLLFQGRSHIYEGVAKEVILRPVALLKELGGRVLIQTNASGALKSDHQVGDVVLTDRHLGLLGSRLKEQALMREKPLAILLRRYYELTEKKGWQEEPLQKKEHSQEGRVYSERLIDFLWKHAKEGEEPWSALVRNKLHRGTYIGVDGPNYETPAEAKMYAMVGDCIGMSTVFEAEEAYRLGLETIALSVITNKVHLFDQTEIESDHVLEVAKATAPVVGELLSTLIVFLANAKSQEKRDNQNGIV
ncbi:MAG: purine-nucleoside phosphorylase [Pirellulaceae bacterium]|nr:purine-nucleoside phosphorylase [Pirellulaceae bacterium]